MNPSASGPHSFAILLGLFQLFRLLDYGHQLCLIARCERKSSVFDARELFWQLTCCEERVLQQRRRFGAVIHLLDEALLHKLLERRAPFATVFERGDALLTQVSVFHTNHERLAGLNLGSDEEERTQGWRVHIGRFALAHLHQHDPS
jgi:hypothetical protein